jgi:hypothetical protein
MGYQTMSAKTVNERAATAYAEICCDNNDPFASSESLLRQFRGWREANGHCPISGPTQRAIMPRSHAADVALRREFEAHLRKRAKDGVSWRQGTSDLIVGVGEDLIIVDLSIGLYGALHQLGNIGATR